MVEITAHNFHQFMMSPMTGCHIDHAAKNVGNDKKQNEYVVTSHVDTQLKYQNSARARMLFSLCEMNV